MTTEHFSVGVVCATEGVLLILTVYLWSKSNSESARFVPFRRFVTLSAIACLVEIVYSSLVNIHYSMPGVFYQSLYGLNIFMGSDGKPAPVPTSIILVPRGTSIIVRGRILSM